MTKHRFLSSACLAALLLVTAPVAPGLQDATPGQEAEVRMLRMKSGDILWCSVVAHDPDGVTVQRLESGGRVRLPWAFLDPEEEHALRLVFGYVDPQADELMIDADRFLLADGTEVVGRIVNRTEEHVWVKRAEGTIPISKRLIAGAPSIAQVPALDIFTKEELYQNRVFELQAELVLPGTEGAIAHDELARFAERLFDYSHALEHYRLVQALDASYEPQAVQAAITRSEAKAKLQDQVDYLAQIDLWRARKRYDKALEMLQAFPELYSDSPLMEDWNKLRDRVERYQERDLREEVVRRWHYWATRHARDAARSKMTYEQALAFADEELGTLLLESVRDDLQEIAPGISEEEVQRLWSEREGGRWRQASYGLGTWLLGEARARDTLEEDEDADEEEPTRGSRAEARKKLEQRVKRYLQNQELARKAKVGTSTEEEPEVFWDRWKSAARSQWLMAYFVENSGEFQIAGARFSNCRECAGVGTRDVIDTGSAIAGAGAGGGTIACPTCHTIGVVRRIRYR